MAGEVIRCTYVAATSRAQDRKTTPLYLISNNGSYKYLNRKQEIDAIRLLPPVAIAQGPINSNS